MHASKILVIILEIKTKIKLEIEDSEQGDKHKYLRDINRTKWQIGKKKLNKLYIL